MDKRFFTCIGIIFAFAVLAFLAYSNLEVYPRNKYTAQSREVSANYFHAMEQWLKETGRTVSVEYYIFPRRLIDAQEKVIMVSSNAFYWYDNTEEITKWIEQGGFFILCLDTNYNSPDENLVEFLSDFGISFEYAAPVINTEPLPENEEPPQDTFINFQSRLIFHINNEENFNVIKNNEGFIKLAELTIGKGSFTVTGMPVFMYNNSLKREANAKLAWSLTGARISKETKKQNTNAAADILFVREQINRTPSNSLLGAIFERGNFFPVIISAVILILSGFWMVIPGFGLVFTEKKRTSRPVKDRFTAEISFLKKHHALDYYLDIYSRERKTGAVNKSETVISNKEVINAIRTAQAAYNTAVNNKSSRLLKNK